MKNILSLILFLCIEVAQGQVCITPSINFFSGGDILKGADFNGDGITDLATASYGSTGFSILLGTGIGNFSPPNYFFIGSNNNIGDITVADFNGDGKKDLAALDMYNDKVSVLLGNGLGTFGTVATYSIGVNCNATTLNSGDFNNDGFDDIVTTNYSDLSILLGTSTGSFGSSAYVTTGNSPLAVLSADFNGDGILDLAVTSSGATNNLSILVGTGTGTFGSPVNFNVGNSPQWITKGDFNSDGYIDLATSNHASNNISVLLGTGTASFASAVVYSLGTSARSNEIICSDFNGDGILDLSTANNSSDVSVLLGTGMGNFAAAVSFKCESACTALVSADFNGDGKKDLVTSSPNTSNITLLIGNGLGSFITTGKNYYSGSNSPLSIASADINSDGLLDLVTANGWNNDVTIFQGVGAGAFSFTTVVNLGSATPSSIISGDFNNDGKADFATANGSNGSGNSNNASILTGDGAGNFTSRYALIGVNCVALTCADFNGDGKVDLVSANPTSNNITLTFGNGSGSFNGQANFHVGSNPMAISSADFNGDGKTDIATANSVSNDISILLGTGTGNFVPATNFAVGAGPSSIISVDFNADGNIDLAVTNNSSNNVSILLGLGNGGFASATNYSVSNVPNSIINGDFNGDGFWDIATANYTSHNASVLLGDGTGNFGVAISFNTGGNPRSIISGDFNNDGRTDLSTANGTDLSVLLNCGSYSVGISEFKTTNDQLISLYPNPTIGKFNLDFDYHADSIEIYNVEGKKIYSNSNVNKSCEIDFSQSPKGMYLIKINGRGKVVTKKLLVQ